MARRAGGVAAMQVQRKPYGAAGAGTNPVGTIMNPTITHVGTRSATLPLAAGRGGGERARVRFGRARETTADLLRPETVDKAAVEGGTEESRGTASKGVKSILTDRRRVLDGSERGHSPIALSDAAAAPGGAG